MDGEWEGKLWIAVSVFACIGSECGNAASLFYHCCWFMTEITHLTSSRQTDRQVDKQAKMLQLYVCMRDGDVGRVSVFMSLFIWVLSFMCAQLCACVCVCDRQEVRWQLFRHGCMTMTTVTRGITGMRRGNGTWRTKQTGGGGICRGWGGGLNWWPLFCTEG